MINVVSVLLTPLRSRHEKFLYQGRGQMAAALMKVVLSMCAAIALLQSPAARADDNFLEPDAAFKFSARLVDAKTVEVIYNIADGYYLYRERLQFKATGARLGAPGLPAGKVKYDETFQKDVETYRHNLTIHIPVDAASAFTLTVTSQGCADKGLCYAPMESKATLGGGGGLLGAVAAARGITQDSVVQSESRPELQASPVRRREGMNAQTPQEQSDQGSIDATLKSGKLFSIVPLFLLLGIGLSLTPCVLPMVPILASIIVGEGAQVRRRRGFVLAATYSLGMVIVYTMLGIAAGLIGEGLSATLQNPWVLGAFAILMVALSLSMFGVYQLQVPAGIQLKLMQASDKQAAGKLLGVFVMGALSALIVGPCVAAPLAGALVYISQSRDAVIGGSALFSMAIGMSVPLLLVGISAGALLPRAGTWMESVKRFFGVLMLGVALWMVSPVIPSWVQLFGWAVLGIGYGICLMQLKQSGWLSKFMGIFFLTFGLAQLVGVITGGRDVLAPLAHLQGNQPHQTSFKRVNSVAELDSALTQANGKIAMLDFYADWCVSCKEMEKLTFTDTQVQARLSDMLLLQIDVTKNNADDKSMLKRFGLFGPPGIIFFDGRGVEISGSRVIGYQDADKFQESLRRATGI